MLDGVSVRLTSGWESTHLDVAKDVAETILGDEVSEICSQSHVYDGALVVAPFQDRKAFEEDEALAIEQFVAHGCEVRFHVGERKFILQFPVSMSRWQ